VRGGVFGAVQALQPPAEARADTLSTDRTKTSVERHAGGPTSYFSGIFEPSGAVCDVLLPLVSELELDGGMRPFWT